MMKTGCRKRLWPMMLVLPMLGGTGCEDPADPGSGVRIDVPSSRVMLYVGDRTQLDARVIGSTNTGVTWSIASGPGLITTEGEYLAPQSVAVDSLDVRVSVKAQANPAVTAMIDLRLYSRRTFQFAYDLEGARSVALTADHGIVAALESPTFTLVRFDSTGDHLWLARYGAGRSNGVRVTDDGGIIAVGSTADESQVILVRTDGAGRLLWQRLFSTPAEKNAGYAVRQTGDGGFIVGGMVSDTVGGTGGYNDRAAVFRTDPSGNLLWWRGLSGRKVAFDGSVLEVSGGHVVAVFTWVSHPDSWGVGLVRFDQTGQMIWERIFPSGLETEVSAVAQTQDGGFIITGSTGSGAWRSFLLRTDAEGQVLWQQTLTNGPLDWPTAVHETPDGGFLLTGWHRVAGLDVRSLLIKATPNGRVEWQRGYGEPLTAAHAFSSKVTSGGRYVLGGEAGGKLFLLRTDPDGRAPFLWKRWM